MKTPEHETPEDANELVFVYNKGDGYWQHGDYKLGPNGQAEVPRFIAKMWCDSHRSPVVMQKPSAHVAASSAKILAELEAQKSENVDLLKRIENLEKLLNKVQSEPASAPPANIKARLQSTPTVQK